MTVCDVVVVVGDEGDASMIRRSFIAVAVGLRDLIEAVGNVFMFFFE